MNNTIPSSGSLIRFLLACAAVICLSTTQSAYGQSLNVCESYELHPENQNVSMNVCIAEWSSNGTPQVDAYVQVTPDSNSAGYLVYSDAEMILSSTNTSNNLTFLGQSDWNNYTDQPEEPSFDTVAGVTAAMTPSTVYDASAGYGFCYDPTGNYGWDEWDQENDNCVWTDYSANPNYDLETNFFDPAVQVLSVLYPPPGDLSTTGYTNATTNGTTSSVGSSFTQSYGVTFSGQGSTPGDLFSFGGSIGYSHATTSGNTTAFQTTLTDTTGVTEEANTRHQYNPNQLDMPNHLWDSFVLLLNSQITTANDDSNNIQGYSVDIQPIAGEGWATEADAPEVVAEDMINGTVPQDTLNPVLLPLVNGHQYSLPGLAAICESLITSEYNSGTCTLADQCGCQKSDFSPVLGQDALLRWNPSTLAANPMPGYESPLDADASGGTACYTPSSGLDCRYVPVPTSSTNSAPQIVQLNYAFANPFTQTDATSTSITSLNQTSYTVTLTGFFGWNISAWGAGGGLKLTSTNSWTWTNSESTGSINGTQNSMNVNLQTNNSGCVEDNYVYEDTLYHTFVIQPPGGVPNCLQ